MGARFSAPVQTGSGARPASRKMGTGFFPGVKSGRGVTLTPQPLLVQWSRKSRTIPLLPLWAVRPVQNLSACTRVHFTFTLLRINKTQIKIINTEKSEPCNKQRKKMRGSVILLLLRRLLADSMTFCAFEEIQVPTTGVKRQRYNGRYAWGVSSCDGLLRN